MPVSRRHFLQGSAVATAALTTTSVEAAALSPNPTGDPPLTTTALPSEAVIALHRMGYGPRPGDIAVVQAMGVPAYIEQQLHPDTIDDSACDARIAAARMRIRYPADPNGNYPAVDELRPFSSLTKQTPDLWKLWSPSAPRHWLERERPREEVQAATWLRAIYSKRQLKEVLVDFWHNHFNINAVAETVIAVTFPVYDRDVIRAHCLGNFRVMLEAMTRSTEMMHYLDNISNRIGAGEGGNENFARELLELHTLGSDAYLKFYDDRRQIGTITYNGVEYARGYIDDDVYEVARCFTGWTIKNRAGLPPSENMNDGTFYYDPAWHDTNPKTVLSPTGFPNIPRNQPNLKDGQDVLTILAGHPATARHVCTKLCRRFISDTPPNDVIEAAVATWMANLSAPDQLRRVMRTILTSRAFATTWGQKMKRPFEALMSYLRATNAEIPLDDMAATGWLWELRFWIFNHMGQRLFAWPTPNGYPDSARHWLNTNYQLWWWQMPVGLTTRAWGEISMNLVEQTNMQASCTVIVDAWIERLYGFSIDPSARQELIALMAQGSDPTQPPRLIPGERADGLTDRLNTMVRLLAMAPDFFAR